jgi:uncharacterized repeat protein (TIGR02543 family)
MASGKITLSYTTTNNDKTSATVSITMTYYGNGQTYQSTPSSNNCYITLPGYGTKYFTHAYTKSTAAQEMGSVEFTISKTHSAQSLTATGGITNYSTVYSNPTGSCTISVDAKASYTISYGANGHGTAPAAQTKWHGEGLVLQPAMSATGWTFVGWSIWKTATTARYNASGYYTDNAAATLYGIWQKDITLSYNANSGSGAPASQTNTIYNTTTSTSFVISSTRPTRTNYDFLGWLDGSTLYQPGDTISNVTDSKELVASWKLAYIPPQIISLEGKRLENNNSQATITINWTKGNDGSDIATTQLLIAYKLSTSQNWIYIKASGDTSSEETWINSDETTYSTTISTPSDNQYNIQVKVRNSNYTSSEQTKTSFISATFYVIDITADGKGIGFLTSAPSSGINIASAIKGLGIAGLTASGAGGIAIGARNNTNTITSAGSGSIASGFAQSGSIEATTKGAFAGGLADGNNKITASGDGSLAFGLSSNTAALTASGRGSIAMGIGCTASGDFSLAHNMYTTATGRAQTVLGTWNIIDSATTSTHPTGINEVAKFKKYAFIIGNGTSDSARSNAFAVTWDGKVELNSEPLFKWTQIGSGSNTTNKITFSSATTNYNEIMVVASTLRSGGYHLFSGVLPATIIDNTEREFKLSGGVGGSTATNCGAWGKIVTSGFTPVGVWINNTAFNSSTTWYIYGR